VTGMVSAGRREVVGRSEGDRPLPVLPALEPLFPAGGLRRGSAVTVRGSASLLLALLAGPSRQGAWCGVVGLPGLGLAAAAEAGIALDRLALVPDPGRDWPAVAAALLDAMEVVVVAPRGRVPDPDVRRLAARARQRGAVLVPFGSVPWPGAEVRLSLTDAVWEGLGDGSGRLRSRRVLVRAEGRGSAARGSELALWMPAPDGEIRAVPALHALPTPPDLFPAPAPTPHLHAVPDLPTPAAVGTTAIPAAGTARTPAAVVPAAGEITGPAAGTARVPATAVPTAGEITAPVTGTADDRAAVRRTSPAGGDEAGGAGVGEVVGLRAPARRTSSPGGPGGPEQTVATPAIAALWQDVTHRPGARPPTPRRTDPTTHPRPAGPPRRTPRTPAARTPSTPVRSGASGQAGSGGVGDGGSRLRSAGSPVPAERPAPVGGGPPAPPPPTAGPRPSIPADVLARLRPASTLPKPPPKTGP
jgi:hypothetical protein